MRGCVGVIRGGGGGRRDAGIPTVAIATSKLVTRVTSSNRIALYPRYFQVNQGNKPGKAVASAVHCVIVTSPSVIFAWN
ncbi:hypothetical protein J6590_015330 [Homalodisca vitripennis]|nr:hypothetical protein J6590_015330 [Homalodisca vitripennis]